MTPEIRERAVQLLIESEKDYPSNWAAITAIAHIHIDHDMDFIREEPEFKSLMEKYESAAKAKFSSPSESEQTGEEITTEVPFTKENGICNVKCMINDLPLYFVFDTGASTVSLSMVEATFMM